jgi:hypothetical protein
MGIKTGTNNIVCKFRKHGLGLILCEGSHIEYVVTEVEFLWFRCNRRLGLSENFVKGTCLRKHISASL